MENLKALLENHFIYKEANRELYYSIYDSQKEFRPFLAKLGYQLIVRNDFLRLEKFPADIDEFMGIRDFTTVAEYIFFTLLLIFLEDKGKDEQFLLADVVEFFETGDGLEVDTTLQRTRRQICHVLAFAKDNYLISLCGGDAESYITDAQAQALYDNTGLSKYFMRNFPADFNSCNSLEDLQVLLKGSGETDAVAQRRNAVYRNLLLRPAVYNLESQYDQFGYIKNFRSNIAEDFEKYLSWTLHVQKEIATVVPCEEDKITDLFPGKGGINTPLLLFNREIRSRVDNGSLKVDRNGRIHLNREEFLELASYVKETKSRGFIQTLRTMSAERFAEELILTLRKYMMCESSADGVVLLPAIGKVIGDYPKSFYDSEGAESDK